MNALQAPQGLTLAFLIALLSAFVGAPLPVAHAQENTGPLEPSSPNAEQDESTDQEDSAEQDEATISREARALLIDGKVSEALELLHRTTGKSPEEAAAWRWMGYAYLSLASQWLAKGENPHYAFLDALSSFERALGLDPLDRESVQGAYEAHFQLSQFDDATAYALRDLSLHMLREGDVPGWALERVARARSESFLRFDDRELDTYAAQLADAWRVIEESEQRAPTTAGVSMVRADLLQRLGLMGDASRHLQEAIRRNPSAVSLHQALIDTHFYQNATSPLVPFYESLGEAAHENATVCWYHGYASLLEGDGARMERRFEDAIPSYRDASHWLLRASALEPAYDESVRRIDVLARAGVAWCSIERGELDRARSLFISLLERSPEHAELRDGLRRTITDGVSQLGAEYESLAQFEKGAQLAREMTRLSTDPGPWWNNLGYFLREYATQIESGAVACEGDPKEAAREVFRESWNAYLKATSLTPDDARVVNDTALIQIYHLRDELEKAISLELDAIKTGEEQLAAMGENATREQRFPVAQAVGDAYQNLGYLAYHVEKDYPKSRDYMVKSIEVEPTDRELNHRYIKAIDGETPPIEERGAFRNPPRSEIARAPQGRIPWERTWADALARSKEENRPIFLYRGGGLSLAVPFWERFLMRPDVVEATQDAVCVVADSSRYNMVDRRKDGTRLFSNKYGSVTSADHIGIAIEVDNWWREHRSDEDPETLEEGFHLFDPELKRLNETPTNFSLDLLDAPEARDLLADRLESWIARLQGQNPRDRRAAAHRLTSEPAAAAHDAVEALLFGDSTSRVVIGDLVEAVASHDDENHRDLLKSLLTQTYSTALSEAAAERWPADAADDPLRYAFNWSPSTKTRSLALGALAARGAEDRELARLVVARLVVGPEKDRAQAASSMIALGDEGARLLIAALEWERAPKVRAALCSALGAYAFEEAREALMGILEKEAHPIVTAAARRALNGDWTD